VTQLLNVGPEGFVERSIPADERTWDEDTEVEDGQAERDA